MRRRDTETLDLLNWEPTPVAAGYSDDVAGRGAIGNRIARLVSRALRDAKDDKDLSRVDIAKAMSVYLGRSVTAATLNQWSSEATEDRYIPLDAFAALIDATGDAKLLGFLPGLFCHVAVPEKYEAIIQLHQVEEQERRIAAHKASIQSRLRSGL